MTSELKIGNTTWTVNRHARAQMQRRGIRSWMADAAIRLGKREHSHGRVLYLLTDRTLVDTLWSVTGIGCVVSASWSMGNPG
jgi:hypothetical protein